MDDDKNISLSVNEPTKSQLAELDDQIAELIAEALLVIIAKKGTDIKT